MMRAESIQWGEAAVDEKLRSKLQLVEQALLVGSFVCSALLGVLKIPHTLSLALIPSVILMLQVRSS
jgi:hypothetical protein